jgi:hypothetical protein
VAVFDARRKQKHRDIKFPPRRRNPASGMPRRGVLEPQALPVHRGQDNMADVRWLTSRSAAAFALRQMWSLNIRCKPMFSEFSRSDPRRVVQSGVFRDFGGASSVGRAVRRRPSCAGQVVQTQVVRPKARCVYVGHCCVIRKARAVPSRNFQKELAIQDPGPHNQPIVAIDLAWLSRRRAYFTIVGGRARWF